MNESIERIPSGREILKNLEAEDKYVFHGSENPDIDELEPRQGYNHKDDGTKEEDGEPAVFASDRADYAILMALINKKNCPKGYHSSAGSVSQANGEVHLELKASKDSVEQLDEDSSGYVYVFDKSVFQQRPRKREYISVVPVTHTDKIKVVKEDLPPELEIFVSEK